MNAERDVSMMGRRDLFAFGKASDRRDRMRGCHEPPHQYFYAYLDLETSTTYAGPRCEQKRTLREQKCTLKK
jgi:hypothetical protein